MLLRIDYKFKISSIVVLTTIAVFSLLTLFTDYSFSQIHMNQKGTSPLTLKRENNSFSKTPDNNLSPQQIEIESKMNQLKQSNDQLSGEKILQLQNQFETINGITVTKQETNSLLTLIPNRNSGETDNLTINGINANAISGYVAGLATQVEQRGAGAGRIWLAVGLAPGDTGLAAKPDTLALYYSNNNGSTYNLYAKLALSSHNKFEYDDIDMEIIENTAGTKYIYIVYGYITNGYRGQHLVGYTVITTTGLSYSGSGLVPPGFNSTNQYTRPRITSDNANYASVPYVDIVFTQDSVANTFHYYMSKFCRILSPFTVTPSITYFPHSIYGAVAGNSNFTTLTDIAYYNNASDTIIFLLSNYPGFEPNLYFYKAFSNSSVYPNYSSTLTPTGDNLQFAKLAANGGANQTKLLATYSDNRSGSGNYDQYYLTSDNANNWSAGNFDLSFFDQSRDGDVIGRRGANGSFDVSFINLIGSFRYVTSCHFNNSSVTNYLYNVNNIEPANSLSNPKPGFRYVNNDSSLTLWGSYFVAYSTGGNIDQNLYLTLAIDGYYDEVNDRHYADVGLKVILRNAASPYNAVDSADAFLYYQSLKGAFVFGHTPNGNYYLEIEHRNALETWSSSPVSFTANIPSVYNFTTSDAQAFGNNMVQKGSKWCLYSGDLNRDGFIDLTDVLLTYNDALNFVSGTNPPTDLNGDLFVDLTDVLIVYNSSNNFPVVIRP